MAGGAVLYGMSTDARTMLIGTAKKTYLWQAGGHRRTVGNIYTNLSGSGRFVSGCDSKGCVILDLNTGERTKAPLRVGRFSDNGEHFLCYDSSEFIYDCDRKSGTRFFVSIAPDGSTLDGYGTMSGDGRVVAFWHDQGCDTNGGLGGTFVLYLRDTTRNDTIRLGQIGYSCDPSEIFPPDPSLSFSGDEVAFMSDQSLDKIDTNERTDAYIWYRATGHYVLVSRDPHGKARSGPSTEIALSSDGAFAVYRATEDVGKCSKTVPNEEFEHCSGTLYRFDTSKGSREVVSLSTSGAHANGDSSGSFLAKDGRVVSFISQSSNLVASSRIPKCRDYYNGGTAYRFVPCYEVYLRDVVKATTVLISES